MVKCAMGIIYAVSRSREKVAKGWMRAPQTGESTESSCASQSEIQHPSIHGALTPASRALSRARERGPAIGSQRLPATRLVFG